MSEHEVLLFGLVIERALTKNQWESVNRIDDFANSSDDEVEEIILLIYFQQLIPLSHYFLRKVHFEILYHPSWVIPQSRYKPNQEIYFAFSLRKLSV
jgi:hypothetical protein